MSGKWDDAAQAEARARHEAEYNELLNSIPSADDRALETMGDLEFLWLSVAPNKTSDDFEAEIHEPFNTDDPDLDDMVEEYSQSFSSKLGAVGAWPLIEAPIRIAYGYAYSARLAAMNEDAIKLAWKNVDSASFWYGYALGLVRASSPAVNAPTMSEVAQKAAYARNAENRAIRNQAFKWLDDHFEQDGLTNEGAAEELRKVVPVTFSTRLSYVKKWKASR